MLLILQSSKYGISKMHFELYLKSPRKSLIFIYKKISNISSSKYPEIQIMVACKIYC